jgi:hypothetical protein
MPIVERLSPPAYISDFNSIPGQLSAWHTAVADWFDDSIGENAPIVNPGPCQFYNPARFDPGGLVIEQAITWNAFPKELLRLFGRDRALCEADRLWTLDRYYSTLHNIQLDSGEYPELFQTYFRPQNEYCEWHVARYPETRAIRRVTFTSEPPEFWYAFFGSPVPNDKHQFVGAPDVVLRWYQNFVSSRVVAGDLIAQDDIRAPKPDLLYAEKGRYNVYNKWNTTHGIVHLCAPPNTLMAEIRLGADATVLRKNAAGRLLVEPEVLICCAQYGSPNRNSDPTIGATLNAAARLGAHVTLKDPIGIYMDHIDLSGWEAPDKKGVADCVRIVRGMPQMIERMVVEVPPARGFTVSDIEIGGEPIAYGGQIAECVTVKLVGICNVQKSPTRNVPVKCCGRCCLEADRPASLTSIRLGEPLPPGCQEAFVDEGAEEEAATRKSLEHWFEGAERSAFRRRAL